jgi:glycosyltransferase involved in cell wall biosynthesis
MSEPLPISVCIVARNEEGNLPRLLGSVCGWAAEIVVVLNNTTDASASIAERYGARVEHRPWIGYRDTKNVALQFASQPWVLALDADEEISLALREEIKGFFTGGLHTKYAGARFPRKTWFLGRWILHGDWYPDRQLRLFRQDSGRWGGSPEHDKIELAGACAELRAEMHHFSNPTIASHIGKINVFSDYFLKRQLERGVGWSAAAAAFRAVWRFVRAYVFRLGFLDGFPGLFIAVSTAYATFVRYSRLYEQLYNTPPPVQAAHAHSGGEHVQRP